MVSLCVNLSTSCQQHFIYISYTKKIMVHIDIKYFAVLLLMHKNWFLSFLWEVF